MKAAFFKDVYQFEVRDDVPIAEPEKDSLVLKVDYCSICGSDLHGYKKGLWTAPGLIMGHEYAGTVYKLGPDYDGDLKVGDRITVCGLTSCGKCDMCLHDRPHLCPNMRGAQGAYAEFTTPAYPGSLPMFYKLPDSVSTLAGAMVEPLSVGLHAAKMPVYQSNDTIVVIGAGMIGLCTMQCARALNAGATIIQIDLSDMRLEKALELGADYAINPTKVDDVYAEIEKITGPQPQAYGHPGLVDVVFECCGLDATVKQAQDLCKGGGYVISVAVAEEEVRPAMLNQIVQKELIWRGSYAYKCEFAESIQLLAKGAVDVEALVSHTFKLDDITEAFETQMDTKNSIKVVMDCRS